MIGKFKEKEWHEESLIEGANTFKAVDLIPERGMLHLYNKHTI
jgi:hypothetical protein